MIRISTLAIVLVASLAACTAPPRTDSNGNAVQGVYRIKSGDTAEVQFRMLDSVNAIRTSAGLSQLQLNAQLNAAAATHSRDMANQNRPWHFGSDGSSPLDRVARTGYQGFLVGENISETYENETETLAAWMKEPATRNVVIAPQARNLGISWFQERNGKIWWTMVTGS